MTFQIIAPRELRPEDIPRQNSEVIMVMAERYTRAVAGMEPWARSAKKAVDYVEGKQWSAADMAKAKLEGRPTLKFNKMNNLLRLVMGYYQQQRTEAKYLPDDSGAATADVADGMTKISHRIGEQNDEMYVETESVMDGLITGRGYIDQRLSYETNGFGDVKVTSRDPFFVRLDPDGSSYNLNETCSFVIEDRMASIDEIQQMYGAGAYALLYPLVFRSGYSGMPGGSSLVEYINAITPWRDFGGGYDVSNRAHIESFLMNAIDTARKSVRIMDVQHKVRVPCKYWMDLETGDLSLIPPNYAQEDIQRVLAWNEQHYASLGQPNPIRVIHRMGTRMRWTTMVGDIIVYDKWSPYDSYTMTPYFPYFRRGVTRGMMEDLTDPQDEVNKRRSANIDITTRTAHSGWKIHADSMSPEEEAKLRTVGAAPGFLLKWKGQSFMEPKKIEQSSPSQAFERLELRSADDLKEISGVNDSLLGLVDKVQSGRALEARQKQGVMTIQMYMDNRTRTALLKYKQRMRLIQQFYTQQRAYQVISDTGVPEVLQINKKLASGVIVNDVTMGKYFVSVDTVPVSATFMQAQFEELKELADSGIVPKEILTDVAIDISTLPHKDALKKRAEILMASMGLPTIQQLESGQVPPMAVGPNGQPMPAAQAGAMNPAIGAGGPPGGNPGGQKHPQPAAQPA